MLAPIVPVVVSRCKAGVLSIPEPSESSIAPEPLADNVTDVPPVSVLPAMSIAPLLAVVVSESVPAESISLATLMLLLLDTEKLVNSWGIEMLEVTLKA